MSSPVFVSYSRSDARLARPVVELLRARDDVFHDMDSIRPGAQWRQAIREAVDSATLIYVLWCSHSAASPEVRGEVDQARDLGTPIVPVLLDSTPLREDLRGYQWVDLSRATVHRSSLGGTSEARRRGKAGPRSWIVVAAVGVLLVLMALAWTTVWSIAPEVGGSPTQDLTPLESFARSLLPTQSDSGSGALSILPVLAFVWCCRSSSSRWLWSFDVLSSVG